MKTTILNTTSRSVFIAFANDTREEEKIIVNEGEPVAIEEEPSMDIVYEDDLGANFL